MAIPTEADFALVKIGDGATPTEVFTLACGLQDVSLAHAANTSDKFSRDCATPGAVPVRTVKVNGKQLDISADGLIDQAQIAAFYAALGQKKNYKIELYQNNDTDTGLLLGTVAGNFVMDGHSMNIVMEGDSSAGVTLKNNGAWTWTVAP